MKFVKAADGWHLMATQPSGDSSVIATLKNELEARAVHAFCEKYLMDPSGLPIEFQIRHGKHTYTVTCPTGRGGKLVLHILGDDGSTSCIETEFIL